MRTQRASNVLNHEKWLANSLESMIVSDELSKGDLELILAKLSKLPFKVKWLANTHPHLAHALVVEVSPGFVG